MIVMTTNKIRSMKMTWRRLRKLQDGWQRSSPGLVLIATMLTQRTSCPSIFATVAGGKNLITILWCCLTHVAITVSALRTRPVNTATVKLSAIPELVRPATSVSQWNATARSKQSSCHVKSRNARSTVAKIPVATHLTVVNINVIRHATLGLVSHAKFPCSKNASVASSARSFTAVSPNSAALLCVGIIWAVETTSARKNAIAGHAVRVKRTLKKSYIAQADTTQSRNWLVGSARTAQSRFRPAMLYVSVSFHAENTSVRKHATTMNACAVKFKLIWSVGVVRPAWKSAAIKSTTQKASASRSCQRRRSSKSLTSGVR